MLAAFEQRLVEVLGAALPAPFTGRVRTAAGTLPGNGPAIVVAVVAAVPVAESFSSARDVRPASLPTFRRVARLQCTVAVDVVPGEGAGRAQRLAGIDDLIYQLTRPDLLTGRALDEAGVDQGFHLDALGFEAAAMPVAGTDNEPAALTLFARGLFWPVGIAGETGIVIGQVRLRSVTQPIVLAEPLPRLVAGGASAPLRLAVGATGRTDLTADAPPARAPFDRLSARLVNRAGGPGAGVLTGGEAGADGSRVVALVAGAAEVAYTPPAERGTEYLVLATEEAGVPGLELARFALRTMPA